MIGNMQIPTALTPRFVVGMILSLFLNIVLVAAVIWKNVSDPRGELFNKHEWSIVQTLKLHPRDATSSGPVITLPRVHGDPDYDAIGIRRKDQQGWVWILSNSAGVPRLKLGPHYQLQQICGSDYERIKLDVRLNSDVDTMLKALAVPDC
jgi:hypothetical protein